MTDTRICWPLFVVTVTWLRNTPLGASGWRVASREREGDGVPCWTGCTPLDVAGTRRTESQGSLQVVCSPFKAASETPCTVTEHVASMPALTEPNRSVSGFTEMSPTTSPWR